MVISFCFGSKNNKKLRLNQIMAGNCGFRSIHLSASFHGHLPVIPVRPFPTNPVGHSHENEEPFTQKELNEIMTK